MATRKNPPPEVTEFFRKIGKKYGAKGAEVANSKLTTETRRQAGKKAAAALSPEERKQRARKAAKARWANAKKDGTPNKPSDK